jgi:hypothetical protein
MIRKASPCVAEWQAGILSTCRKSLACQGFSVRLPWVPHEQGNRELAPVPSGGLVGQRAVSRSFVRGVGPGSGLPSSGRAGSATSGRRAKFCRFQSCALRRHGTVSCGSPGRPSPARLPQSRRPLPVLRAPRRRAGATLASCEGRPPAEASACTRADCQGSSNSPLAGHDSRPAALGDLRSPVLPRSQVPPPNRR